MQYLSKQCKRRSLFFYPLLRHQAEVQPSLLHQLCSAWISGKPRFEVFDIASKMLNKFWKTDFKIIFAFFFLDNQDSISKVHSSLFSLHELLMSSLSLVRHMTSYSVDWAANHRSLEVIVFLHKITYDGQAIVYVVLYLYLCALYSDKLKASLGLFSTTQVFVA